MTALILLFASKIIFLGKLTLCLHIQLNKLHKIKELEILQDSWRIIKLLFQYTRSNLQLLCCE